MKRICVLVEGHTERDFVSTILAPYFGKEGILIAAIPMLKSGGGMGFSNLEHFKNNVKPLLYEQGEPIVTTLVDLYRFPVHFPNHPEEAELIRWSTDPDIPARLQGLQNVLTQIVKSIKHYPYFIPYIQQYEFEALLFSDPLAFGIQDPALQRDIELVLAQIPEPEEINTTSNGHPAQRLTAIFSAHGHKYVKGADAVEIAEVIGIETILRKCPRFRIWIETLFRSVQDDLVECEL